MPPERTTVRAASRAPRAAAPLAALAALAAGGDPDLVPTDARRTDATGARDTAPADGTPPHPPGDAAPVGDAPLGDAAGTPDAALPADYGRLGTLRRDGDGVTLRTNPTANYRGIDVAYDPMHRVFLVVYGNAPIGGALLDDDGHQIGDGFRVTDAPYDGSNWTQLPRVAYGDGAFVATWHASVSGSVAVQARRLHVDAATNAPAFDGAAQAVSALGSHQESPPSVAYSPATREFVVVWQQDGIKARRLGSDGAPRGDVVSVSTDGVWAEQPSVVYHPGARAFFVAYAQVVPPDGAHVGLARLEDGTARVLEPPRDLSGTVSGTKVTDVAYDAATGDVIASFYLARATGAVFAAIRLHGDGTPASELRTVFAPYSSYDGYDLAWSAATGTSLAAFHSPSLDAFGAELDPTLTNSPPAALTAATWRSGFFIPRVVAHPARPFWLVFGSADYASVVMQRVARDPAH